MSIEVTHDGAYLIYALDQAGYLVQRRYYGYTKLEAVRMFREETGCSA